MCAAVHEVFEEFVDGVFFGAGPFGEYFDEGLAAFGYEFRGFFVCCVWGGVCEDSF